MTRSNQRLWCKRSNRYHRRRDKYTRSHVRERMGLEYTRDCMCHRFRRQAPNSCTSMCSLRQHESKQRIWLHGGIQHKTALQVIIAVIARSTCHFCTVHIGAVQGTLLCHEFATHIIQLVARFTTGIYRIVGVRIAGRKHFQAEEPSGLHFALHGRVLPSLTQPL